MSSLFFCCGCCYFSLWLCHPMLMDSGRMVKGRLGAVHFVIDSLGEQGYSWTLPNFQKAGDSIGFPQSERVKNEGLSVMRSSKIEQPKVPPLLYSVWHQVFTSLHLWPGTHHHFWALISFFLKFFFSLSNNFSMAVSILPVSLLQRLQSYNSKESAAHISLSSY